MAFAPTSFPASGTLLSATMRQNDDNLRKYLHGGVVSGDIQSSPAWIDMRHVQSPLIDPVSNMQHGVTGHLGGRVYQPGERFTMTASSFTRRGRGTANPSWAEVPNTAVTFNLRGVTTAIFHYHITAFVGPDTTTVSSATALDRRVYIAPYFRAASTPFKQAAVYENGAFEVRMNVGTVTLNGFTTAGNRSGPAAPYNISGYGQRTGQYLQSLSSVSDGNQVHFGLAHWSLSHVGLITSWSVCVEAYY